MYWTANRPQMRFILSARQRGFVSWLPDYECSLFSGLSWKRDLNLNANTWLSNFLHTTITTTTTIIISVTFEFVLNIQGNVQRVEWQHGIIDQPQNGFCCHLQKHSQKTFGWSWFLFEKLHSCIMWCQRRHRTGYGCVGMMRFVMKYPRNGEQL